MTKIQQDYYILQSKEHKNLQASSPAIGRGTHADALHGKLENLPFQHIA